MTPGVWQKQKQIGVEEDPFILGFHLFQIFEYNDQHRVKNSHVHKEIRYHEPTETGTSDARIF